MGFQLDSSPQKWLIAGGSKSITVAAELSQQLCLGHVAGGQLGSQTDLAPGPALALPLRECGSHSTSSPLK